MKATLLLCCAAIACSGNVQDVGQAKLTITQVPQMVSCLQVTVTGARNVTRNFDVMAGQMSVLLLNGLPLGSDTFSGAAFAVGCASIGAAIPAWLADPVGANLTAGSVANVNLVMRRNGEANVSVDFQDDDGGAMGLPDGSASDAASCSCPSLGPCQTASCNGSTCVVANKAAGTACDDAQACTYNDVCDGTGTCAGTAIMCISDACTTRTCNGTSSCSVMFAPTGTECGACCTGSMTCDGAGLCQNAGCCNTTMCCTL